MTLSPRPVSVFVISKLRYGEGGDGAFKEGARREKEWGRPQVDE
jgi:hypothetical protein